MPFQPKGINWDEVRRAFIERSPRPTLEELSQEFFCAPGSLSRLSSHEGWPALRAQHMDAQLAKCDAAGVLLEAVRCDRAITAKAISVGLLVLESLARVVESIEEDRAPQTKAQALNTVSFALKNTLDGLRAAGVIGVSKALDQAGKEGNNQWSPKLLQQININFSELQKQAAAAAKVAEPSPPVDVPSASQEPGTSV